MRLHIILVYIFLLALPNATVANCSFKTVDYIDELKLPKSIISIQIEIAKSAKYNKNFYKLMLSDSRYIAPKFKKKFKAIIKTKYKFGTCTYKATVKQNGDFKDHITFVNGNPFRSLIVKIENGNIQKAVKFKLLLPETRGHYNEILGSIITRELGFIAPETFEVMVNVNGTESIMLFQEDATKEMLERHKRREGPIFEGDESLSLAFENSKITRFFDVSLSRLINKKWFSLGKSSETITLKAYNKLQESHLRNIIFFPDRVDRYIISPNKNHTTAFQDYYFLMTAMNGDHALFPVNRKYYYNSFLDSFEPIYYDGNLNLTQKLMSLHPLIEYAFTEGYSFSKKDSLHSKKFNTTILNKFESRVIDYSKSTQNFALKSMRQLSLNTKFLQKEISNMRQKEIPEFKLSQMITQHFDRLKDHNLDEKNIHLIAQHNEFYIVKDSYQNTLKVTTEQLSSVLSKNILDGKRHIFLPQILPPEIYKEDIKKEILEIYGGGTLVSNSGIDIKIDDSYKKITIKQTNPTDWVLFRDVDLTGWTIRFNGAEKNIAAKKQQRFNSHGMTGCLNFYNSAFKDTILFAEGGQCEDTLNIANSSGHISQLNVSNSFADAVDFDFSKLYISDASITNAGNDCLDVSGGSYDVHKAILVNCSDKGLSVGEVSTFTGEQISVTQAKIGISSKDLSKVVISKYLTHNVEICIEARQKKQEFGGALAMIRQMSCEGPRSEDIHSSIMESAL
jgi:hypothetical protein